MRLTYAITFEFLTEPPITERGFTEATVARTAIARAVDKAISRNPNLNWNSISILVEREK
jgi:hypothetical protein